jgi:hypothetical protein
MTAPFELSALKTQPVPTAKDTVPDPDAFAMKGVPDDQKPTKMVQLPASFYEMDLETEVTPATDRTPERPAESVSPAQTAQTEVTVGAAISVAVVSPPSEAVEVVRPPREAAVLPSTAMELRRPPAPELRLEQAGSWQKIWLALQQRPWSSVALVPTGGEISDATVDIAQALCAVGLDHLRQPMSVLDVRQVSLGQTETRIAELRSKVASGERVLVVVGPLDDNPAGVPLANAADAAILCFKLGESVLSAAKKAVETLGRPRFLGAVALRPRPSAKAGKKGKPEVLVPAKP